MIFDDIDMSNVKLFDKYCTKCGNYGHIINDCELSFVRDAKNPNYDIMRKIRGNQNYILNRFYSLHTSFEDKKDINKSSKHCRYCNKQFDKHKWLFFHCLTSCKHKEKIMIDLKNVEFIIK